MKSSQDPCSRCFLHTTVTSALKFVGYSITSVWRNLFVTRIVWCLLTLELLQCKNIPMCRDVVSSAVNVCVSLGRSTLI